MRVKEVEIIFRSDKTEWHSGFSAPVNWDELTPTEQYELIEQWKQDEIDRFVTVYIEVK